MLLYLIINNKQLLGLICLSN